MEIITTYNRFATYTRCPLTPDLPAAADQALDHYLLEKYIDNSLHRQTSTFSLKSMIRAAYYRLRPLFPVAFRRRTRKNSPSARKIRCSTRVRRVTGAPSASNSSVSAQCNCSMKTKNRIPFL